MTGASGTRDVRLGAGMGTKIVYNKWDEGVGVRTEGQGKDQKCMYAHLV